MFKNATINNGRIDNLTFKQAFTVQLNCGETPQIMPDIDFKGMPVEIARQLMFESLKVRGRGSMRGMSVEELKRTYNTKISWRALYSKAGAKAQAIEVSLSAEEKRAMIAKLQAQLDAPDDFDKAVEEVEEVEEADNQE